MKRLLFPLFATVLMVACNNNGEGNNRQADTTTDTSAGNPAAVQPPSEAITESTKVVNDSVVVPKVAPSSGSGANDTTRH